MTYLCRWPNGDFSVVVAKNKDDAIFLLDEVGGAGPEMLSSVKDFMVHFRLKDTVSDINDAAYILEGFGECSVGDVDNAYPILSEVIGAALDDGPDCDSPENTTKINNALEAERKRCVPVEQDHFINEEGVIQ